MNEKMVMDIKYNSLKQLFILHFQSKFTYFRQKKSHLRI